MQAWPFSPCLPFFDLIHWLTLHQFC
jgi:hypothetical protein